MVVWLWRFLLVALSPIVLLGALELGFRALSPFPGNWATYEQRDGYLYFHRPNSTGWETSPVDEFPPARLHYNAQGLRGPDIPTTKPAGERRVLLLGDSYVEARQVPEEKTARSRIESRLRERLGEKVSALNAGVSGTATVPELIYLLREGFSFQPDVVVLFFTFNDYTDDAVHHWIDDPGAVEHGLPDTFKPVEYGPTWEPPDTAAQLARRSALFSFFYRVRVASETRRTMHRAEPFYVANRTLDLNPTGVFNRTYTSTEQRAIDATNAAIVRMRDECAKRGIPFLVVAIPWPHQVSGDEWNPGKEIYGYKVGDAIPDDVSNATYPRVLLDHLSANNIPSLDLLPVFRGSAARPLHNGYDGHWNVNGNTVAADAVADRLLSDPRFVAQLR